MNLKKILLVILFALASVFISPSAGEARPARVGWSGTIVEVVSNLPTSWNVRSAVEDIDWYTGSDLRLVKKCSGKNQCIRIWKGVVKDKDSIGWSYPCRATTSLCKIVVDTGKASRRKGFGSTTKRWLIRHELGHARGLGHRMTCDSTMNPYMRCKGNVPPNAFTIAQRATLRTR